MSCVISGKYKGKRLKSIDTIRPTMGKVKNAMFNMLNSRIDLSAGFILADFFCGTGSIAIEAISRGAEHVFMIDNSRDCLKIAHRNITAINSCHMATLINVDATRPFNGIDKKCHVLFMDPPYDQSIAPTVLANLAKSKVLYEDSIIMVELHKKGDLILLNNFFKVVDERCYGNSKIIMLQIA